jgi:hypothetical protein
MKCLVEDLHNCVQVTKCFYFAHSWRCPVPPEVPQKWLWHAHFFNGIVFYRKFFKLLKQCGFISFPTTVNKIPHNNRNSTLNHEVFNYKDETGEVNRVTNTKQQNTMYHLWRYTNNCGTQLLSSQPNNSPHTLHWTTTYNRRTHDVTKVYGN